jgi:hypothetical protein
MCPSSGRSLRLAFPTGTRGREGRRERVVSQGSFLRSSPVPAGNASRRLLPEDGHIPVRRMDTSPPKEITKSATRRKLFLHRCHCDALSRGRTIWEHHIITNHCSFPLPYRYSFAFPCPDREKPCFLVEIPGNRAFNFAGVAGNRPTISCCVVAEPDQLSL